jgi:hypothetical protein
VKLLKILAWVVLYLAMTATAAAQGSVVNDISILNSANTLRPVAGATITVCTLGATGLPCNAPLTIYSCIGLTGGCSLGSSMQSDVNGNYEYFIAPGNYTETTTAAGYVGKSITRTLGIGTFSGGIAVNQVAFGGGLNIIQGIANFLFGSPVAGALNLNTSSSSCPTPGACTLISLTNSGGGTTPFYIYKGADNSICFQNDSASIATHGIFCFSANGTAQLLAGANGPQVQFNTAIVGSLPAGSVAWQLPDTGVGNALFALNTPGNMSESAYSWDTGTGCSKWYPINSSSIVTFACPPASGTTALAFANQCGTVAANAACANTASTASHCISGVATLSGGTSTVTGIAPAFTSATSFIVLTSDTTTPGNANHGAGASGSSITFTGTGTDNIQFIACGG